MMWIIGRQVRNFAWAQGEHDFLIRRGAFFRSMTIVPYGRIQYVDISEGPVSRFFGISTVIIHTASVSTRAFVQGIPLRMLPVCATNSPSVEALRWQGCEHEFFSTRVCSGPRG